ncbi:MAG TPA: GNAT family N-acetyltransferase [bacterium]|nr:GNAT family N-acetyltransferase [bacterium]
MTSPRVYFLKSARLGFGHWTADDLPLALALWSDPDVTRLIGGPLSAAAAEARLGSEIATMRAHGVQYWPIFLLENDAHAGCAGLRPYRLEQRIYEIGFHLRPACWGRGLATEAAQAVIAYAFGTIGAHALFAGHHPANAVSQRVLEKLGFRFTHEELYPPTGLRHPSYLLSRAGTAVPQE